MWSKAARHLEQIGRAGIAAGWPATRIEAAMRDAIRAEGYSDAVLLDALNAIEAAEPKRTR